MRLIASLGLSLMLITASTTQGFASSKIRPAIWLLEAIIVGAVSGYVAARVSDAEAREISVNRNWIAGDELQAQAQFYGFLKDKTSLLMIAGTYPIVVVSRKDGHDIVVIEDQAAERLVVVILEEGSEK